MDIIQKVKGNKLELVGDLDKYGIFMTNKTQVTLEKNMNFLKGENCEKAKEIIL